MKKSPWICDKCHNARVLLRVKRKHSQGECWHGNASPTEAPILTTSNGRPVKFTPERLEQIKNLVERGLSREQIAEMIGVTVGSLQVTCSRLGISLRRPRVTAATNGNDCVAVLALPRPKPMTDEESRSVKLYLHLHYRGRECITELALTAERLNNLALAACMHNMSIGQLIAKVIEVGSLGLDTA